MLSDSWAVPSHLDVKEISAIHRRNAGLVPARREFRVQFPRSHELQFEPGHVEQEVPYRSVASSVAR